ncbi:MAG: tRNA-dihydrouridine synthase family protein [Bacteroidales bacterium]|nr:tRNA-dihydrouridine synthase family protein [Bacteroidales bacterium]
MSTSIYLAPFQGITGVTFRKVYSNHFKGVDKLFTPFFTAINSEMKLPARKLAELGSISENGAEVIPQILSKDADEIIRFAQFCEKQEFTELNWNLGCPYPMVANKKRGSGMLPYPEMVDEILEKVMAETTFRFSVKCRLGYFSSEEIFKLVPVFNHHKISELTIHARIGKQLYTGEPDLDTFQKAISLITVPVVYNGDIFSINDFHKVSGCFPTLNTWMIGRGLLSDPFLPAIIKGLPIETDRQVIIRRFIDELYSSYRRQLNDNPALLGILKEYWHYLAESFDNPHKVFKQLKKVKKFDEYEAAVDVVFGEYEWLGSEGRTLSGETALSLF